MAEVQKHIYRSSNALLGGVCSGIAQRFDMDTALVRMLAVALSVLTLGLFVFVYLAAWLVLPVEPGRDEAYDVSPDSIHSEFYEQVVVGGPSTKGAAAGTAAQPVASIPPTPPAAASGYYAARAASTTPPVVDATASFPSVSTAQAAANPAFSRVLAGGILLIAFGVLALFVSLGFYTLDPGVWARHAGPLLLVAIGLFIMGRASKSDIIIVAAGIALALFVVVGVASSIQENSFELGASLSFSPDALIEQEQSESSQEG